MSEIVKQDFYDVTKVMPVVSANEIKDIRLKIFKWGDDNYYPNYLAYLKYACAIHGGILTSKTHYTVSGGLNYDGTDKAAFDLFFKNGNSDYNLDELSENLSRDLEVFNGYAFTVSYVRDKPYQFNHIPFELLRKGTDGKWRSSNDWSDRKEAVTEYETFNPLVTVGQQLIVYMEKPMQIKLKGKLTKGIYPVPTYSGGVKDIETNIQIADYRGNEIYNNLSLGSVLNLNNGKPATQEDEDRIIDEISNTAQGSSNAGGVWVSFNNGKDKEASVVSLNGNNQDSRYLALSKDNKENILLSHSVTTGLLFGIKTEGQLGGLTEIETLYNLMKNGYFAYRQKAILSTLEYIGKRCLGLTGVLTFNEVSIKQIETEQDNSTLKILGDMSPLLANKVLNSLTQNEIRKLANLEPLEGGDVVPTPTTAAFSSDMIINEFAKVGRDKSKCKILYSRPLNFENFDEENFKTSYQKFEISDKETDVLNLVNKGLDNDSISKELGIGNSKLIKIISTLENDGYLKDGNLTTKGSNALIGSGKAVVSVVYSYEVKEGLGAEVIPTTREFCREIIKQNKFYTRAEIDQISDFVGTNVWLYKGGYYHNPDTHITTTSCRHYWQQNAILE